MQAINYCALILLLTQFCFAQNAHHSHNGTLHRFYPGVPEQYQDFVNFTLSKRPLGICQKEVP